MVHCALQNAYPGRQWEEDIDLGWNPYLQTKRTVARVDVSGNAIGSSFIRGYAAEQALECFLEGHIPTIGQISFHNPDEFVSGQLNCNHIEWKYILDQNETREEVKNWIENGVDIHQYIRHFKGSFWGVDYDADYPLPRVFSNSNKSEPFKDFITNTVLERIRNGSVECVGRVDKPPYVTSPLTVEPTKPGLCINLMYLDNWIADKHFSLDTLKDVPRVIEENEFMTILDDKNAFDQIRIDKSNYQLFGFQWAGYYFVLKTLPFGFKLSSYIYHTITGNLQPVYYIRKRFGIPIFLYIDDPMIGQVRNSLIMAGVQRR